MATYLVEASEKENKHTEQKHSILTQNRMQTIEKREMSLEQLNAEKEENKLYWNSFECKNNESKNKILCKKLELSNKDLNNNYIKQIEDTISLIKNKINNPEYIYKEDIPKLKAIIIELKKDQYFIKNIINHTINFNKLPFSSKTEINYYIPTGYENENEDYTFINDSRFYFSNPNHISALIQYYSNLKEKSWKEVQSTIHWILIDFEKLIDIAFSNNANNKNKEILICKLKGYSNEEINQFLIKKYNKSYSISYISHLLNSKIPNFLSEEYKKFLYEWIHFYQIKSKWKKCTKCGQVKLANHYNFSPNKRGKYGLHSICRECRKGSEK